MPICAVFGFGAGAGSELRRIGFGGGADAELRCIVSLYFACIAVSLCPICAVLGLPLPLMPNCAVSDLAVGLMANAEWRMRDGAVFGVGWRRYRGGRRVG